MLTLTENAATAVKNITGQVPQAGPDGGLRIAEAGSAEAGFELSVTAAPGPDDTVVENDGARVFLEPTAAAALDDRVLDASVDAEGGVRFALGAPA